MAHRLFDRREAIAGLGLSSILMTAQTAPFQRQRFEMPARIRGINLEIEPDGPTVPMASEMATWGVNAVRINFSTDAAVRRTPDDATVQPRKSDPLHAYRRGLDTLRSFTSACASLGIGVVLAASGIAGRRSDLSAKSGRVFQDAIGKTLTAFWGAIARELRDDPAIFAYDVLNEPNYSPTDPDGPRVWRDQLLPDAIRLIRSINSDVWIMASPWPWSLSSAFENVDLIDDPRIIYSFHEYAPHNYTHQGVGVPAEKRTPLAYPGPLREFDTEPLKPWNRAALLAHMKPALDFRDRHGVRMMASEFGCARWAPGRDRYIEDLVSIFEAEGLDWLFHSYASWNGWNPSFAPNAPEMGTYPSLYGGYSSAAHQLLLRKWRTNRRFS